MPKLDPPPVTLPRRLIIQVRGTSGSGKSWVMRQFMSAHKPWIPTHIPGRKRPLYYTNPGVLSGNIAGETVDRMPRTVVLGHYDTPCGGCDTIGSSRSIYNLANTLSPENQVVVMEGLLLSEDVKWTSQMVTDGNVVVVLFLDTPLEKCLEQIRQRRLEVGNNTPLNPTNTTNRITTIQRAYTKLRELGSVQYQTTGNRIYCIRCSPARAPRIIAYHARRANNILRFGLAGGVVHG